MSAVARSMDGLSLCLCPVLSLKISRDRSLSVRQPYPFSSKASFRVYRTRRDGIVHRAHSTPAPATASTGQPAPPVEHSSRVPSWGSVQSLSPFAPSTSLSPAGLFTRTSSWPKLIMPLHLGGTSLKPFLGFPSFLLVSTTADSLDIHVEQAAEPQTVRGTGPSQVLGVVGTEFRGKSTRTRAVLASSETSVVDPATTGGSLPLSSPLYVILHMPFGPSTKSFPPRGEIWSTFAAFGSRLRVRDGKVTTSNS